jgi:hypothetical protein
MASWWATRALKLVAKCSCLGQSGRLAPAQPLGGALVRVGRRGAQAHLELFRRLLPLLDQPGLRATREHC